jgi:site-specific DNA-methyltransferase (adenine-specific)
VDNILTSCEGNVVLDPFGGSGTVGVSAKKHGWDYILIDNSPEYCEMAEKRIKES